MPIPWTDRVKKQKQLTVYLDTALKDTVWSATLKDALDEFNLLARKHKLGLTLKQSGDAPATRGAGGADVAVALGNGDVSATYDGEIHKSSLGGTLMHGRTFLFSRKDRVEKAFVFLPWKPQVNTPKGTRDVGPVVLKLIAVHEFVHACGLTNAEHAADDLFQASPMVDAGSTAAQDRVRIPGPKMRWMPPLILSAATVKEIKKLWGK
jgi:hypothetical protein